MENSMKNLKMEMVQLESKTENFSTHIKNNIQVTIKEIFEKNKEDNLRMDRMEKDVADNV